MNTDQKRGSNQHPTDPVVLSGVRARTQRGLVRESGCAVRTLLRDPEEHLFTKVAGEHGRERTHLGDFRLVESMFTRKNLRQRRKGPRFRIVTLANP